MKIQKWNSFLEMKIHFKESLISWYNLQKGIQVLGLVKMLTIEEQKQADQLAKGIRRLSLEQLEDPNSIYDLMKIIQKRTRHSNRNMVH